MVENNSSKIVQFVCVSILLISFFSLLYISNFKNKIFVSGKMAGNGEYKYDSLVQIDNDNVLVIGGGCGDKKAEIYNISSNTFKELSAPNFLHSVMKNTVRIDENTILIVSTDGVEVYNQKTQKFSKVENSIFKELLSHNDINNKNFHNIKFFSINNRFVLCIKNYMSYKDKASQYVLLYFVDYDKNKILNYYKINKSNIDLTFFEPISDRQFILKTTDNKFLSLNTENDQIKYYTIENIPPSIKEKNNLKEKINKTLKTVYKDKEIYIHEPIILNNGNALFLSEKENYLFNSHTNKIKRINNFEYWRRNFSTIKLPNGNVLIVGGSCGNTESHSPFNEVEMFKYK